MTDQTLHDSLRLAANNAGIAKGTTVSDKPRLDNWHTDRGL